MLDPWIGLSNVKDNKFKYLYVDRGICTWDRLSGWLYTEAILWQGQNFPNKSKMVDGGHVEFSNIVTDVTECRH